MLRAVVDITEMLLFVSKLFRII